MAHSGPGLMSLQVKATAPPDKAGLVDRCVVTQPVPVSGAGFRFGPPAAEWSREMIRIFRALLALWWVIADDGGQPGCRRLREPPMCSSLILQ